MTAENPNSAWAVARPRRAGQLASLKATLGANVKRLIHERAGRTDTRLCHVWTQLAADGWSHESRLANRAANIKRIARGELWPDAENLELLAEVLGVEPWELLRPWPRA